MNVIKGAFVWEYSGIYSGYSVPGSRIPGMEIQVFRNRKSSQTNANLYYSNYSYSGLIPNEHALNIFSCTHHQICPSLICKSTLFHSHTFPNSLDVPREYFHIPDDQLQENKPFALQLCSKENYNIEKNENQLIENAMASTVTTITVLPIRY